ncbi:hypothetical protein Tco_0578649, partial [Tanacetum coccineum]
DASPIALSSGYVASKKEEDEEEEEHLAPADCTTLPVVDPVPSAEDTEVFETDESAPTPPLPRLRRSSISVRPQTPMSAAIEALIAVVAAALPSSPSPSPLTLLSYPLSQIPSPPLPLPSPPTHTSPTYAEAPLGYKAAMIQWRAASPSTHPPSKIPSLPLLLPSTTRRYDLLEVDMSLRKRAHFTAPTGRFEVEESSSAAAARQTRHTLAHRVDYGFIDTVDASIRASESRAMTAIGEVNERVTDLATTQRQETHELRAHFKSRSQAMEAQIIALQRDVDVLQRLRIRDEDRVTSHIQHEHDRFRELVRTAEAGP